LACGDHFFVWRRFGAIPFQHHAIELGEGEAIHFSDGFEGPAGPGGDTAEFVVGKTTMNALTRNGKDRVFFVNYGKLQPSAGDTIRRAQSQLGRRGYHLFHDNCEHFATWCVTGKAVSAQVRTATERVGAVAMKAGLVVAAKVALRSTRVLKPWTLAADAVQFGTEAVGCHVGLADPVLRKRTGQALGGMTALGIGAFAGPAGIALAGGSWLLGEISGEVMSRAISRRCTPAIEPPA